MDYVCLLVAMASIGYFLFWGEKYTVKFQERKGKIYCCLSVGYMQSLVVSIFCFN